MAFSGEKATARFRAERKVAELKVRFAIEKNFQNCSIFSIPPAECTVESYGKSIHIEVELQIITLKITPSSLDSVKKAAYGVRKERICRAGVQKDVLKEARDPL
jgi:hypothetical protein